MKVISLDASRWRSPADFFPRPFLSFERQLGIGQTLMR